MNGVAPPLPASPALLDAAMGTALLARGLAPGALPEEWVLGRPGEIAEVHRDHAAAGARLLLTCTFNVASPRLERRLGPGRVGALCEAAARLARGAAGGALVAGAVGPTGLSPPLGSGEPAGAIEARYAPAFAALAAAGVDLLWLESQHDLGEALAALSAARRTGLAAAVTFALEERDGTFRTHGGADPLDWLVAVEAAGAVAAGLNCVFPGGALTALAARARPRLRVPLAAKPSPGLPGAVRSPEEFAAALRPALVAGIGLAGGCCGATGEHLRAIGEVMKARPPSP
jgi:5-methyltetrahydrofolate--homocysteine methyltransferase